MTQFVAMVTVMEDLDDSDLERIANAYMATTVAILATLPETVTVSIGKLMYDKEELLDDIRRRIVIEGEGEERRAG